jgi:hypothetical protein
LVEIIHKSCGLDIHKQFFIATLPCRFGEKHQQRFERNDEGILAFKKWAILEKCDVVAYESTSDFWVPIYDSLIKHLPVIKRVLEEEILMHFHAKPMHKRLLLPRIMVLNRF